MSVARKRDIKLSLEKPDHEEVTLALDPEKIERVFFNLVSNAFKYTPDNGRITVSYSSDGNNLTLKVSDTGEGISERDLGNIFDRFFQVDQVHPKGSGIGLSLAKAFVELHHGTISVESTPGKGSVFTVILPISHVSEEAAETKKLYEAEDVEAELGKIETELTMDSEKPLVLVIDDNNDIQKLVGGLLNTEYNVISAGNGADGLRKAMKYVPDLVICDVMMPVMDGIECLKRLKEEVSTSHIPVLMLTACSMDEQRVQGYENGADGYLSKPFGAKVLLSRCASLISNRRRIKELWAGRNTSVAASGERIKEEKQAHSDIESEFYSRFLEIFTSELGNPDISVDNIASKMGLERTQFYRKIKALTNYSPVELMRNLRLKHARNLIATTDKNVSEVAYESGFSTPAYFTKCYRDAYGETPTETRNKLGK